MPGGFIRREPTDSTKLRENQEVVELFTRVQWISFCDKLQGYDDEVAEEFLQALKPKSKTLATVNFRGLSLKLTPQYISRITELPMGLPWDKEERKLSQQAKKEFFPPEEEFSEDKNGVRRTSLLPPWNEVSLQIMKYITCEGRFSIVYAYHFRLLTELRHRIDLPVEQKLSIPYFLLQSLMECATKLKEGIPDQIAHHGLIKLLVEDALHSYKVPLSWESFRNLTKDGDIKMLIEETGSSSSEEQEAVAEEKREKGQKTPTTVQKKEQKKKHEEKDDKEKGGTPILSAREKRLKSRMDKAEVVHVSPSTSSAPATKAKSKTQAAKQAKVETPVSTGKQKQASTGSPKTETKASTGSPKLEKGASTGSPKIIEKQASTGSLKTEKGSSTGSPKITKAGASTGSPRVAKTGSSTGSPKLVKKGSSTEGPEVGKAGSSTGSPKSEKKGPSTRSSEKAKRKEEKAGILEKEAAAALAALSTPPKPKEKRERETPLPSEARRSKRINTGKPQPPPSSQTILGDVPTSPSARTPSKTSATPERGSPKITSWTRKIGQSPSEARLKEMEKGEEAPPSSPPGAEKAGPPKTGKEEHAPGSSSRPKTRSQSKVAQG